MDYRIYTLIKVLIGAALFFVFIGRKMIPRKLHKEATVFRGIDDHEKIDAALETLEKRLEGQRKSFAIPKQITDILDRDSESQYALNLFLQEVAGHVGYDRTKVTLRLYPAKNNVPPGRISKLGSQFLMELHMDCSENTAGVLAVIVHEFCHYFLDSNGMKLVNTLENEILTDTAAIYLGFGYIMREGYRPTFHIKNGKNTWNRIGYLDVRGIEYAMERCGDLYTTV